MHTINRVEIAYDSAKSASTFELPGLSFEPAAGFDFQTAALTADDRHDFGETRYRRPGSLDGRLYALAFVETARGIRAISFRIAHRREVRRHEPTTQP